MKKLLVATLVLGLIAAGLSTSAVAKKKAAPKAYTLYFHGTERVGEVDAVNNISNATFNAMDATEPSEPVPASMWLTNYAAGPNSACAANPLFPFWVGKVTGKVVGNMKVTFDSVASPGTHVDVRVWADITSQQCGSNGVAEGEYPEPLAEAAGVELPAGPGQTEVELKGVKFPVASYLMVQITPVVTEPSHGRVLYDSPDYPSKIEFTCIGAGGKSCTQ